MALKLANNAVGRLATNISPTDTTISLKAGDGAVFPTLSADDWFPLTLTRSDGRVEIMRVTARSGDVLTVERGMVRRQKFATDLHHK